jgi:hypothetical protein
MPLLATRALCRQSVSTLPERRAMAVSGARLGVARSRSALSDCTPPLVLQRAASTPSRRGRANTVMHRRRLPARPWSTAQRSRASDACRVRVREKRWAASPRAKRASKRPPARIAPSRCWDLAPARRVGRADQNADPPMARWLSGARSDSPAFRRDAELRQQPMPGRPRSQPDQDRAGAAARDEWDASHPACRLPGADAGEQRP